MTLLALDYHAQHRADHLDMVSNLGDKPAPALGTNSGRRRVRPQPPHPRDGSLWATVDSRRGDLMRLTFPFRGSSTIPSPYYKDYPYTHRFLHLNREGTTR